MYAARKTARDSAADTAAPAAAAGEATIAATGSATVTAVDVAARGDAPAIAHGTEHLSWQLTIQCMLIHCVCVSVLYAANTFGHMTATAAELQLAILKCRCAVLLMCFANQNRPHEAMHKDVTSCKIVYAHATCCRNLLLPCLSFMVWQGSISCLTL